jgi:hypothetical protein
MTTDVIRPIRAGILGAMIILIALSGCVASNDFHEVTIIEKYPADSIFGDNFVKISSGDILPVETLVFDEIQINHTYIVKLRGVHTGWGIEQSLGIVDMIKEVENEP